MFSKRSTCRAACACFGRACFPFWGLFEFLGRNSAARSRLLNIARERTTSKPRNVGELWQITGFAFVCAKMRASPVLFCPANIRPASRRAQCRNQRGLAGARGWLFCGARGKDFRKEMPSTALGKQESPCKSCPQKVDGHKSQCH